MATKRKPLGDLLNLPMNRDIIEKQKTNDALSSVNVISERDQDIELPLVCAVEAFEPGTSEVNELSGDKTEVKKRISRKPNVGRSRILYILRCKKCKKIYTGETTYTLAKVRSRLIREVERGTSQRKVAVHFRTAPCGKADMEFIEKKQIGNTDRRINHKRKMIEKLNSKGMGLNSVTPRKRRVDGRSKSSGRDKKQVANKQDIRSFFNVIKRKKSTSNALKEKRD